MGNELKAGHQIEPLELKEGMTVADFVDNIYANSGYNARRLAEACKLFQRMIDEDVTICLTVAGAMTPIGMSGPIIRLMERGYVDWIISTGANLYHDLHRTFDFPMVQGDWRTDDNVLHKKGIARIYDVYIHDDDTLLSTDKVVREAVKLTKLPERFSTADLHNALGAFVQKKAPHPERSLLGAAALHKVPVYTSSPGDSSIGMNLALPYIFGKPVDVSTTLDVIETSAIVWASKMNGAVELGGGSPKNFFMQTQPTLWQILNQSKGGHDYFIQITTDSPQWGGLSGATPQEAKSWGKVKDADINNVVVYSDSSIAFPILAQYVLDRCKPRKRKEFFARKDAITKNLIDSSKKIPELRKAMGL
jgi:deoxyhypusine synthase